MSYNPLLDSAPDSWGGCAIRTDFRQGLKFFRIASDKELDDNEKAWLYIRCFFETTPPMEGVFDFISLYVSGGEKGTGSGQRVFDFDVDAGRLYAAFYQVYGIDLKNVSLHWWDFLELFKNLPEGTVLHQVMDIRGKKIKPGDSPEYRRELAKAKAAVALDNDEFPDLFGVWK